MADTQPMAPTDDEIDAVVQACRERGLRELDVFRAVLAKWGAPQQEAQEPVMIYHGDCTIDCGEHGHHHVELLRMIPAGSKLYTAPQPSPASQGTQHGIFSTLAGRHARTFATAMTFVLTVLLVIADVLSLRRLSALPASKEVCDGWKCSSASIMSSQ